MSTFEIDVAKSELSFAAGHFITYGGGRCERLHGHNYRVGVRISGELNDDGLVYDFVALKRRVSALVADLDHKMLVQTENLTLGVDADDREVRVLHGEYTYVFPRRDVVLLPIENTTAPRPLGVRWRPAPSRSRQGLSQTLEARRPVLNGLGDVRRREVAGSPQVRDGSGHPQDAVIGASAEAEALDGRS